MPTVSNPQTVTRNVSPAFTAAYLSTLFALPVSSLTVKQLRDLVDASRMLPGGSAPASVLGSLFQ